MQQATFLTLLHFAPPLFDATVALQFAWVMLWHFILQHHIEGTPGFEPGTC